MPLPVDIDTTYPDDAVNPGRKAHQQHHDALHEMFNNWESASGNYRHVQSLPSALWTVVHNLGYRPGGVHVVLSDGSTALGHIIHVDDDTLTISLGSNSLSGEAYVS